MAKLNNRGLRGTALLDSLILRYLTRQTTGSLNLERRSLVDVHQDGHWHTNAP